MHATVARSVVPSIVESQLTADPRTVPVGSVHRIFIVDGWIDVTAGVVDGDATFAYTTGQCHALAFALWERTGWPLVAVGLARCLHDFDDACIRRPLGGVCPCQIEHLCVQHPDGRLVDIDGAWGREGFESGTTKLAFTDTVAQDLVVNSEWRTPNLPVARAFVEPVLAQL